MTTVTLNGGAVMCAVLIILIAAYTTLLDSIPKQRSINKKDRDTVDAEYIQSQNAVHRAEYQIALFQSGLFQTAVNTLTALYGILVVTLLVMGLTVLTQWITVG